MSTKLQQLFSAVETEFFNPENDWMLVELDGENSKRRVSFFSTKEEAFNFFEKDFITGNNLYSNIYGEMNSKLFYYDKDGGVHTTHYFSITAAVEQLKELHCLHFHNMTVYVSNICYDNEDIYLLSELKNKKIGVENLIVNM